MDDSERENSSSGNAMLSMHAISHRLKRQVVRVTAADSYGKRESERERDRHMEEPERPEQQADWPGRASDGMTNRLMVNRAKYKAAMHCM